MKDALIDTIKVVDCIIINDAEARQLTDEPNIHKAARKIMDFGLKAVVIKRGEYGATLFTKDSYFAVPAYPLESVFDPTGAGDTFAGGFMGYLASQNEMTDEVLRRAMIYGSVMASFNVEKFGTERVDALDHPEINERFAAFQNDDAFRRYSFRTCGNGIRDLRHYGEDGQFSRSFSRSAPATPSDSGRTGVRDAIALMIGLVAIDLSKFWPLPRLFVADACIVGTAFISWFAYRSRLHGDPPTASAGTLRSPRCSGKL